MSIERPTFSENWHRVADLKPRLRSIVKSHRQYYRSRMWHVLADPVSNQFFRLDEPAYRFVALLDGKRAVSEAWRIVNEDMGDAAPTQGEAIQLLGQLYTSNLLQAELPPDSEQMFARYRKRVRKEVGSYFMNFLFARFPIFNPQPLLRVTTHLFGWLYGPIGFMIWLTMLIVAFWFLAGHWGELLKAASPQSMLKFDNILLLGLCFVFTKAVHELFGHAYACAHFGRKSGVGGPVHTIGIMLMVLMPVPYVDASSSWAFRNKWHRAIVAAAGMYTELFVAAIAAVVWTQTTKDTVINDLAFNTIFIASISTLLFNGNPLLRFDGYYILSDITEIANLAQRSKQYLQYLVKKYVYGVRHVRNPAHTTGEKVWLPTYGIAAFIYRIFICIAIFIYIFNIFPFVGAVMAIAAMVGWVLVPIGKWIKYLAIDGEVERVRGRAVTVTIVWFIATLVLLGAVPISDRERAQGVVEPVEHAKILTQAEGFVEYVLPTASVVKAGTPLLIAKNPELESQRDQLTAQMRGVMVELGQAREQEPERVDYLLKRYNYYKQRFDRVQRDLDALTIRAPFDCTWSTPGGDELAGTFLRRGEQVGVAANRSQLIVIATADQSVDPEIYPGITPVEIRVNGNPTLHVKNNKCEVTKILPAGQVKLPSPTLALQAGGSMYTDPSDPNYTISPFQEIHISIDSQRAEELNLYPGQRVVARFDLPPRPILSQVVRSARQLFQQRFSTTGRASPYQRFMRGSPATN